MTTFGVTTWAVNRLGWAFGYYNYSNPYVGGTVVDNSVYNYSQPIIVSDSYDEEAAPIAETPESLPPDVNAEALASFDAARQQFYAGQYEQALNTVNSAITEMPNDAVLHEFRALVLFALGNYQDAAATLYAVLSAGPGWDWTTMSGLYPSVEQYTEQLRALETYQKENPNVPAAQLVLAYHYLTAGHQEAAQQQLEQLLALTPDDPLAKNLLLQIDPDADVPSAPAVSTPPEVETAIQPADVVGDWKASRDDGSTFDMQLEENGNFAWTYTQGGQPQSMSGTYSIDEQSVLAMDTGEQGVLLAQLVPTADALEFYILGDTQGAPPLSFSRSP